MKKIILTIGLFLTANINSFSQLPDSYPFETFLDDDGFLYVAGNILNDQNDFDILVQKFYDTSITTHKIYIRKLKFLTRNLSLETIS